MTRRLKTAKLFVACLFLTLGSCNSDYTPRPTGYFKISFPQKSYRLFDEPGFPYSFEYPTYGEIINDSTFFDKEPENPYWLNINFPSFRGKIYISYNIIGGPAIFKVKQRNGEYVDSAGRNTFDRLLKGSYTLTYKHTYKASSIDDSAFVNPYGVSGIYFTIGGNAATANQFLLSDSVKNFLRGALYFDATPNEDSLSIVNDFLKQDMKHLINTFRWK